MRKSLLLSLLIPVFATADVKNDFDPDAPYEKYKTYTFVAGIDMGHNGFLEQADMRERMKNFIAGVLETRGLREVPTDQKHDLAVRYWVARRAKSEERVELKYDPLAWGGYWGGYPPYWGGAWGGYYEEYVIRNYVEGTLIVDLIDPATKELVWRTYLREQFEKREGAYEQLKKATQKGFSQYPPSEPEKAKQRKRRAKESR